MKEQTREESKILAAAERQMQAWVRTAEIADRVIRAEGAHPLTGGLVGCLAVSREAGAGGSEIAQMVGERLGWEVLDEGLLDQVAERLGVSRCMLELVDETESSWVYDLLGTWMDRKLVTHDKYVAQVSRVVLAAARRGKVVLVGRGSEFVLPREKRLAVRVIAPERFRVKQIMEREGLSGTAARQFIRAKDRGRREFVQRFFHRRVDDPHLYDLVINVERIGASGAVEQILFALACAE